MTSSQRASFDVSRRTFLKEGGALLASTVLLPAAASPPAHGHTHAGGESTKHIYIAPDDHTDYLWTADEVTYRAAFLAMLDYYLDLADSTAGNPSAYQSRWNCDGSLWVWEYEKNRSPAQFQRLIGRIRDGHVSVPLNPLVTVCGGMPAEAVLRSLYYAGTLERRFDLRLRMAQSMENQTLPYGLGALWAGAGALYSWKGICGCASLVPDAWDRQHDIYWWQGPDGSRILMKWNSMLTGNQGMGGYAEARNPSSVVEYVDGNASFQARYPYDRIGCFGKGWDDLQTTTDEFVTVAQTKTNPTRQVIVSNEEDFFEDIEAAHGASIPTLAASFGNEWELYCASMAEASARVKRAVEELRSAEAMATLVSLKTPSFMDGRQAARDLAWINMGLYWEHCWTADGPVGHDARRDWQRQVANQIEGFVNALHADAVIALGGLIARSGLAVRFFAFNPLSWTRSDVADFAYAGSLPVHVVDLSTGLETPSQIVTVDGQQRLRILAEAVPAVGYKVFEVRSGAGQTFSNAATVAGSVIENDAYRITVANRGAITSLVDKQRSNREFVRTVGGRTINDMGSSSGTLAVENAGPVTVTLKATASSPLAHTSRITLVRNSRRIDIRNDITQNFGGTGYTWAFGFELPNPDTWHEEVGAIIRARLTSAGGHYSPRNARYDWLTFNHFADMSSGSLGVTLANADCYYMKLGSSTTSSLDTATPQIQALAGGQVDGTHLGVHNQGGDTAFMQRFALQTHDAFDPASAMRFALEHQNPLVTGEVTGGTGYPETAHSLLTIDNPNVQLWCIKPADDGIAQGIVVRLWNLSTNAAPFTLDLTALAISSVQPVTHVETPIGAAMIPGEALTGTLAASQMKTFQMRVGAPLGVIVNSFEAQVDATRVRLDWRTEAEYDLLGFNLQRGLAAGGPWTQLNDALIPAQDPGTGTSHDYTWRDDGVEDGTTYWYRLKAVNLQGFGSVVATTSISVHFLPNQIWIPLVDQS